MLSNFTANEAPLLILSWPTMKAIAWGLVPQAEGSERNTSILRALAAEDVSKCSAVP